MNIITNEATYKRIIRKFAYAETELAKDCFNLSLVLYFDDS